MNSKVERLIGPNTLLLGGRAWVGRWHEAGRSVATVAVSLETKGVRASATGKGPVQLVARDLGREAVLHRT